MSMPRVILPVVDDTPSDVSRVTRFDVERFVCGELSGAEADAVKRALDNDPALKSFHDEIVAADAAFQIEHPARAVVPQVMAQAPRPSLWKRVTSSLQSLVSGWRVPALTSAAALALVVLVARPTGTDAPVEDGLRSKGGNDPVVSFFVKSGDSARVGTAGEALHAGDLIQLAVRDANARAMVVVGVDGAGAVSVYAAEELTTQTKGHDAPRVLPASLVLDDTVGTERFFVVYGDDLEDLTRQAKQAAAELGKQVAAQTVDLARVERLQLAAGVPQSSVHIVKVR